MHLVIAANTSPLCATSLAFSPDRSDREPDLILCYRTFEYKELLLGARYIADCTILHIIHGAQRSNPSADFFSFFPQRRFRKSIRITVV